MKKDIKTQSGPFTFSNLERLSLQNGQDYIAKVRSKNHFDAYSSFVDQRVTVNTEGPLIISKCYKKPRKSFLTNSKFTCSPTRLNIYMILRNYLPGQGLVEPDIPSQHPFKHYRLVERYY